MALGWRRALVKRWRRRRSGRAHDAELDDRECGTACSCLEGAPSDSSSTRSFRTHGAAADKDHQGHPVHA
ncbi:MAG: hypothetical protein KJ015_40885, partial [Myxococcales bacterium]|nr:hypothetical protein [Myxococcales bacterium]